MKILLNNIAFNSINYNKNPYKKISQTDSNSTIITFKSSYQPIKTLSNSSREYIHQLIQNYQSNTNSIEFLGKGTFGLVYKILIPLSGYIAVKILNKDNCVAAYGGGKLAQEAEILSKIPNDCNRSQKLIDFFSIENQDYLASSLIKGEPLSQQKNISAKMIDNIVDELNKFDSNGLMFYDLNPDNIKVYNDSVGFFDFEFMDENKPLDYSALNDLHHLGRNIYNPRKSNINAFENRSLGEIVSKLPDENANILIKNYLKALSKHYTKSLDAYDKVLADIYRAPEDKIIEIEKDLIMLKSFTLNYYLYKLRAKNNKLLTDDIAKYGDFNKYIDIINTQARRIKENLMALKNNNEYKKTNLFYIDNFLRMNCSKSSYFSENTPQIIELQKLKEKVISSQGKEGLEDFETLYSKIKDSSPYCKNLKTVLYNTLNLLHLNNQTVN